MHILFLISLLISSRINLIDLRDKLANNKKKILHMTCCGKVKNLMKYEYAKRIIDLLYDTSIDDYTKLYDTFTRIIKSNLKNNENIKIELTKERTKIGNIYIFSKKFKKRECDFLNTAIFNKKMYKVFKKIELNEDEQIFLNFNMAYELFES